MAQFVDSFGEKLLSKDGEVNTADVLSGKTAVGIYFSAHWCPPCKGFTPKLAEKYNEFKAANKGFEIVFVSGDNTEEEFKEYFKEMPWLALPFDAKDKNGDLNTKYGVEGIPHLVILDGDSQEIMTDDGRSVILKENAMEKYPWKPVPMGAHVFGETLLKGKEEISVTDAFADKDAIAIYFSAHWCPPCRGFTPKLAEQHKALKDAGKKFEIIFASSDKNQEAFDEYYAEMPWLALPYKQRDAKEDLASRYKCQGIPYLVWIDPKTWKTITTNGRGAVTAEDFIEDFPYRPKPLYDLSESMDGLMQEFSFVLFNDYSSVDEQKAHREILMPIAKENKALPDDQKTVKCWFTANGKGPESQMRPSFGLKNAMKPYGKPLKQVVPAEDNVGAYGGGSCCNGCQKFILADDATSYRHIEDQYDLCGECYDKSQQPIDPQISVPQMALLNFKKKEFWFPMEGKGEVTAENINAFFEDYKAEKCEKKTLQM